jgi:hypothetical protein
MAKKKDKRYYDCIKDQETGDLYYNYKEWVDALLARFPVLEEHFSHLRTSYDGETWVTLKCEDDPKKCHSYGSWWPNEDSRSWMGVVDDTPSLISNPFYY